MNKVDIKHDDVRYDRYKRFHVPVDQLYEHGGESAGVLFESGEFVYKLTNAQPNRRVQLYACGQKLGLRIVALGDKDAERYTFRNPDGDKLPITYLNRKGMQDLLVDEERGVAVGINCNNNPVGLTLWNEKLKQLIPGMHHGYARVYIAGSKQHPIGHPVSFYPTQKPDKARRDHAMGLISASKAWLAYMHANEPEFQEPGKPTFSQQPVSIMDKILDADFADLHISTRMTLAKHGTFTGFEVDALTYLLV